MLKENAQPNAQLAGRNSGKGVVQPLAPQEGAFEKSCSEWEEKLASYSGDDPLSVWDDYIRFMQQHSRDPSKVNKFQSVLRRCTCEFLHDVRYRMDPRYLRTWIKHIDMLAEPLEAFSLLEASGIGVELALFYVSWAMVLEVKKGLYAGAQSKLEEGLKRKARPVEQIQNAICGLSHRMKNRTLKSAENLPKGVASASSKIGQGNQDAVIRSSSRGPHSKEQIPKAAEGSTGNEALPERDGTKLSTAASAAATAARTAGGARPDAKSHGLDGIDRRAQEPHQQGPPVSAESSDAAAHKAPATSASSGTLEFTCHTEEKLHFMKPTASPAAADTGNPSHDHPNHASTNERGRFRVSEAQLLHHVIMFMQLWIWLNWPAS